MSTGQPDRQDGGPDRARADRTTNSSPAVSTWRVGPVRGRRGRQGALYKAGRQTRRVAVVTGYLFVTGGYRPRCTRQAILRVSCHMMGGLANTARAPQPVHSKGSPGTTSNGGSV